MSQIFPSVGPDRHPDPPPPERPPVVDPALFGPEQPPGHGVGLILGRFMPPHLGHQYLIEFASNYVAQLTVLIRGRSSDLIAGDQRVCWLRDLFPEVSIILVNDDRAPQHGAEDTTFFNRWNLKIRQQIPTGLDYLFASEKYGPRLADMLGAKYIPVDPARLTVPISASQIRENPLGHWEFIPPCVRPYYLRRVCLIGPEATGKSTLAEKLAKHYATCYVGEYARVLRELKRELQPADVQRIARAQLAAERTLARRANRVLFLDTDVLAVQFWSERRFGLCPEWVCQEAQRRQYDLYLVMDVDGPSVGEPQQRQAHLQRCLDTLEARGMDYVRLSGSWEQRFEKAVAEVDDLLRKK
jgi:HTH-type transcriptional regulator, transcriptional repressor of NAD biosynthesis genes